jgi:hypothetical protein
MPNALKRGVVLIGDAFFGHVVDAPFVIFMSKNLMISSLNDISQVVDKGAVQQGPFQSV